MALSGEVQGYDHRLEWKRVLEDVTHGFEGTRATNLPRCQPFVDYFRGCRSVLDVGCGDGMMLELLRDAGVDAAGIDKDADRVAAAMSKGLTATTAEAHSYLDDKVNMFDGIFLRHVIEHFDGPDGVLLLYLCRRALTPGGTIVAITPNFGVAQVAQEIFWLDITHRRPYPLALLRRILSSMGIGIRELGVRGGEPEQDAFIVGRVPE